MRVGTGKDRAQTQRRGESESRLYLGHPTSGSVRPRDTYLAFSFSGLPCKNVWLVTREVWRGEGGGKLRLRYWECPAEWISCTEALFSLELAS